ncbi:hypothetical protein ASPVEDRAFT_142758 [Aspergillus versicolor CBS 583.65]|uniref:Methyltransferase domain-containing protein n=1 Tax=Aspergillus versicolor CBS 583.65 TaxID=1036611 RepID=A0A1L9Q179_ASPVE|nr:uncharacterized protein ASPVEDRAFT_142758 [Aspergillus versicolor CBS 583.65]OJJ07537.1 hypothetical protein ASPVEDRAFT_142758 [Aspergillus versicolor CBS 583.65]
MRPDPSRTERTGAPDYDDPSYWDTKFATGQDIGEWLNPGEVLLDALLSFLEDRPTPKPEHATPRVLHLGPGVSKLGTRLRDAFVTRGWTGNGIVNVDFSSEAVRLGQEVENKQEPSQAMHWIQADLRSWTDVSRLLPFAPYDAILDKSTSDAIATSSPVTLSPTLDMSGICPKVQDILPPEGETTLSPTELLALHLAPLTKRGCKWFVLSYSTMRFDNVPHLFEHWEVVARTPFEAPSGSTVTKAYTPPVYHWLYVLRRK